MAQSEDPDLVESGIVSRVTYPVFRTEDAGPSFEPIIRSGLLLSPGLAVFHDGGDQDVRLEASADGPVFDIAAGQISYLSVSATLPVTACAAIGPGRLLDVDVFAATTRPVPVYLRLNLETQPEPVILHDLIIASDVAHRVAFNFDAVAYPLDDARDGAWVDLIFSKPCERRITLKDLSLAIRIQGWPERTG